MINYELKLSLGGFCLAYLFYSRFRQVSTHSSKKKHADWTVNKQKVMDELYVAF